MSHTTTHTTHRNEQRRQPPESTGLGVVDTSELAADNSDDDICAIEPARAQAKTSCRTISLRF